MILKKKLKKGLSSFLIFILTSALFVQCPLKKKYYIQNSIEEEKKHWLKAGFSNIDIEDYDNQLLYKKFNKEQFTHEFDLTVVIFKNSGWSVAKVIPRIKLAARILSKNCFICINRIHMVQLRAPVQYLDTNVDIDFKICKTIPHVPRPVIFYIRSDQRHRTAYTIVGPQIKDERKGTAWITRVVTKKSFKKARHASYSVEAHELVHILTDYLNDEIHKEGHIKGSELNLMSENPLRRSELLKGYQCEKMKKNKWVRPLRSN